jgi:hypothetical protein
MNYEKRELLKYLGDPSQLFGVKEYRLSGGWAEGVRAVDIRTGSGLEMTVLPDRNMDIAQLSYKGTNLSYMSKTGIVSPQYYSDRGNDFLRSFYAGFLTTCGLRNVGPPCRVEEEEFGLHGRISHTPAEQFSGSTEWVEGHKPVMTLKGRMREARLFGENLILERKLICRAGENSFIIEDRIENYGFREEPLMLLYHFNFGYPLLDENTTLIMPSDRIIPRDEEAEGGKENWMKCQKPTHDYREQVFYHDLDTDGEDNTFAALINEKIELAVVIHFNKKELSNLTQWKMMGEGEYVVGIEPCNCSVSGRAEQLADNRIEYLNPGESRNFKLEIEIREGISEINKIKETLSQFKRPGRT